MDLSNAHSVVSLMNSVLAPTTVGGSSASGDAGKPSVDFGSVLKSSLDRVDASQQKAESISRSFEIMIQHFFISTIPPKLKGVPEKSRVVISDFMALK